MSDQSAGLASNVCLADRSETSNNSAGSSRGFLGETSKQRGKSGLGFASFGAALILLAAVTVSHSSAQQIVYNDFNTPQANSGQWSTSCNALAASPSALGVLFCFNNSGGGLGFVQDNSYNTTIDPNENGGTAYALELTQNMGSQSSSVWYTTPQNVAGGFTVWYAFRITNPSSTTGDGLAFVIQNADGGGAADPASSCQETGSGLTVLGGNGGCIGYGGIDNSVAFEADTFPDSYDPWDFGFGVYDDNHIAMQACGPGLVNSTAHYVSNSVSPLVPTSCLVSLGGNYAIASNPNSSAGTGEDYFANGSPHQVVIVYNGPNDLPANYLYVYLDPAFNPGTHTPVAGSTPIFSGTYDITKSMNLNNGTAYMGFTAATGGSYEQQELMGFNVTPHNSVSANVCPSGQTTPAPCSATIPVTLNVPANTTIGSVQVVTQGATGLDFALASAGTCVGAFPTAGQCTANITFTPLAPGLRQGAVELFGSVAVPLVRPLFASSAAPLATTLIYGIGEGPVPAFGPGLQSVVAGGMGGPRAVALDAAGDIFVAQNLSNQVVEIPAGGGAQTTVGSNLSGPYGVAVDGAGNVFIADTGNNQVVEVPAGGGAQTTVASGLSSPLGVTVDGAGDLFIADTNNNQVLELPAGGGPEQVVASGINNPNTVVVDTRGDLFIVDSNSTLLEIPAGCTSPGCQTTVGTLLNNPRGAAVDAAGDLFIADTFHSVVTEIPAGCTSVTCQITVGSGFGYPWGLAVDGAGDIFITDTNDGRLNEVNRSQPPSLSFAATTVGGISTDSPKTVTVQNVGNTALDFSAVAYPADFPELSGVNTDCTNSSILNAGGICTLSIDFVPTSGGIPPSGTLLSETVSLTDNALNATNAIQAISVAGDGLAAEVAVPNLSGQTQTGASTLLGSVGLTLGTSTNQSSTVPIGEVVSQTPAAGTPVQVGTSVNIVLSSGVSVPGVVGFTEGAASTAITNAGLALAQPVTTEFSDTVPSGTVISQNPAAPSVVNGGTQVSLVVSGGTPPATDQLSLENNYFVTGDYATGGVSLQGTGSGTITIPDPSPCVGSNCGPGVPDGADIRVAYLYWATIENTSTPSGMNGTFLGYPITGLQVGADQPSYSDGTYTGTLRVYRADVNTYLPLLPNSTATVRIGSGSFPVSLPNGGGALPITEGASLVEIYRVLSKDFPLKSVLLYNGSVVPTSSTGPIPQAMQGFYDAVGGASGTGEVTNLFTANGSWSDSEGSQTLGQPDEYIDTMNPGNAYVAAIVSTPVNNTDNDGILDAWKTAQGYTDVKTGAWVPLPGATHGHQDLFVQFDYMCNALGNDGVSCDFSQPNLYPSPDAQGNDPLAMVTQAFQAIGVYLHLKPGNAVLESTYTCMDSDSVLCEFPSTAAAPQPGVVPWNGGVELSKIWPVNFNACSTNQTVASCQTRFPLGQKDSYHYLLFGYSLALPAWNSWYGSLTNINVNGATTSLVTTGLGTTCPSRVTISGVIGNPSLNGVYSNVTCDGALTTMSIATPSGSPASWTYPNTALHEPAIGVTSGTVTTISGYSDLGGSDSVVSLGAWAQNPNQDMSKPATVIAGTMFHEIGHTLGLAHGGLYYDTPGSYIPTYEVNCKPNYQSSMNYLFQLDGVGSAGAVAYSGQSLGDQNDNPLSLATLGSVTSLNGTSGTPAVIGSSSWYVPYDPATTTASPATSHCDGTPLKNQNDLAVRVNGTVDPLSPAWSNNENITFDGASYSTLRGYNDLANLDLRQVAATSNEFESLEALTSYQSSGVTIGGAGGRGVTIGGAGGVTIGGAGGVTIGGAGGVTIGGAGGVTIGGAGGRGVTIGGAGGVTIGGAGGVTIGGAGGVTIGGAGGVEMDYLIANSFVRPPSSPGMTPTPPGVPSGVIITWNAPAFGVVQTYTIYRSVNGAPAVAVGSVSGVNGNPPGTTWTDFNPQGGTVVYTITTTLLPVPIDQSERQSQPSPPAVMKSAQSINLSLPGSASISSSPVTITAIAETNGSPNGLQVNFVATGSCTVAGQSITSGTSAASLNLNSTGTCNITASQPGSSTYDAASSVSGSFQITSGPGTQTQTINLSQLPGVQYGSGFSVSAAASSGVGVTFAASGPCTVGVGPGTAAGTTTGAGKCTITATAPANGNYGIATTVQSFTIYQAVLDVTAVSPAIPFGQPIPSLNPAILGTNYTLTGFISPDGPSAVNGAPALSTAAVQGNDPGSYPITVSTGSLASTNYSFLYLNGNVIIQQAKQAINFTQMAPSTAAFNSSFTVTATGGASGKPVTFSASGPCIITGTASSGGSYSATFQINSSIGTCSVIANQSGNTDYAAAPTVVELVNASGPAVTVTPSSIAFGTVTQGSITTQTITVASVGTAPVAISNPILSLVQGGNSNEYVAVNLCPSSLAVGHSCTITIAFVAGPYYGLQTATLEIMDNAPGSPQPVKLSATVLQPQTITFTANPPASAVYGSQFTVAAGATSKLGVIYTSAGACSNAGATYTMTSGSGTCSVIANQPGNNTYAAAPQVTRTVNATLASQTITFTTPAPRSAAYKTSFMVAATGGSSGNPVTFKSSGACTNSGATFTMTSGTGTCSVIANQAGNSNYSAAPQVATPVTATYSVATLTPTAGLNFGTVSKGVSSASKPLTLTNTGTTPLVISSIAVTGTNTSNFSQTNNCPGASSSLAPTKTCTINVTFISGGKAASASLTVTDNTQAGTQSVSLSGN